MYYNVNMDKSCGYKIRKLRHRNKETLDQVANGIGISPSALGMYERGMRNPDMKVLLKLANYFEVDLKYLYNTSEEEINSIKEVFLKENSYSEAELKRAKLRAKCNCELCGNRAPFFYNNGEPYLEIFLINSIETSEKPKVILLCPNCKRKMEIVNFQGDINYLKSIFEGEEI